MLATTREFGDAFFWEVVSYQYDANSNLTQLTLNGSTTATYQYDVINRLTQLTDNAALNVTFAYDATNKLTSRTLPNGVVSTYQYDGLNRLTRLTHAKAPNTLLDLQYQFNAVNNITQMIDVAGTHNYTYDTLDRLTAATHPNQPNESYTYDDVGNRTASHQGSSYSYQAFNRLVSANGTSFGYDTNGNQITKSDASGSWSYTWDYENRLKQASLSGGVVVTYSYDALGRRVQRNSSATGTTRFVYDGAEVVRDIDGSNATIAEYLNGPGIDDKLRQISGATASYFLTDHLGTTRALSDSSGSIGANLSYDSFGSVTSGSASTRYTYTAREVESETALMYYRARWYEPSEGRFTSVDPIGFRGADINLYRYVKSNPVRYVDPDGTVPLPVAVAAGVIALEVYLHDRLAARAQRFYPDDPQGRSRHCYVNCMSMRVHGFNPVWPILASVEQELGGLAIGIWRGTFKETLDDSIGDLAADFYGGNVSFAIWRSCYRLCESCPF